MNLFYSALGLILAAGVLPFLLTRSFKAMKALSVLLITAGGISGLTMALGVLGGAPQIITVSHPWFQVFSLSLKIDDLAALFLLPIFFIAPIGALYSFHYLENSTDAVKVAANYFFYTILVAAMALVACAANLLTFALSWELMSLSSFFLVIYDFHKRTTRKAGYLYFAFAQGGAMAIFLAFGIIYSYTGSMSFAAISQVPESAKALIFTLAFLGFGSKAGIMPLHVWLPKAHPAAPSHVSAIMSGVMIKLGIYGIIRFYALLHPAGSYCAQLVLIVGAITGVFGVVYALGQRDLKQLLAYSSAENIGIILLGLGLGMLGLNTGNKTMAILGFTGGLLHVINHAIFKSMLFMGAGAVLHKTKTLVIDELGGLMKRLPVCGAAFFIGSIAICGLPPFNGFISEFIIYNGAFGGVRTPEPLFLYVALAILSLAIIGGLAIACFTKVVGLVFLGEPRTPKAAEAKPAGGAIQAAMVILALACVLIGVLPQYIIPLAQRAAMNIIPGPVDQLVGPVGATAAHLSLSAAGFILFVLLIITARRILRKGTPSRSGTWGCGFSQPSSRMQYSGTSYAASFLDFYTPFIQLKEKFSGIHDLFPPTAKYHSETVDVSELGLHRTLVRPVMALTAKLRWLQHGHIQLYIGYIFFALLGLLFWLITYGGLS